MICPSSDSDFRSFSTAALQSDLERDTWEVTGTLQRDKIDVYATYNYSHVEGFVDLERSPTSYLYFILLPLVMVLLSYLGFWINPAATPARAARAARQRGGRERHGLHGRLRRAGARPGARAWRWHGRRRRRRRRRV